MKENIIILAGHYKGIDQRIRDHLITPKYQSAIMYSPEVNFLLLSSPMPL
jgi:tRNA G37 N-methylase TrmD